MTNTLRQVFCLPALIGAMGMPSKELPIVNWQGLSDSVAPFEFNDYVAFVTRWEMADALLDKGRLQPYDKLAWGRPMRKDSGDSQSRL